MKGFGVAQTPNYTYLAKKCVYLFTFKYKYIWNSEGPLKWKELVDFRRQDSEEEDTQTSCRLLFAQYGLDKDGRHKLSLHALIHHVRLVWDS